MTMDRQIAESKTEKKAIIAIHGVGDATPGQIPKLLVEGIAKTKKVSVGYTQVETIVDGQEFKTLLAVDSKLPDIYEANWADVKRPDRSIFGTVTHLLRFAYGFPQIQFEWRRQTKSIVASCLASLIFGIFAWTIYPVLLSIVHATVDSFWYRLTLDLAIYLSAFVSYLMVFKWHPVLKYCGGIWLVITLVCILFLHTGFMPAKTLATYSGFVYASFQVLAGILLLFFACSLLVGWLREEKKHFFANLSFLTFHYISFQILSMFGAVLMAISLFAIDRVGNARKIELFEEVFLKAIRYDLGFVEWGMAFMISAIAILIFFCALIYWLIRLVKGGWSHGFIIHRSVGVLMIMAPLLLLVPTSVLIWSYFESFWNPKNLENRLVSQPGIITIYQVSALRIVPWLALVFSPIATILDAMGDVGLYVIAPSKNNSNPKDQIGTRVQCQERLSQLLDYVIDTNSYESICLIGHSQGSVIAYDVLKARKQNDRLSLITMGSPISTLYKRYLDWPADPIDVDWTNRYRHGDYIGGEITITKIHDAPLKKLGGLGGHTFYWSEEEIAKLLT